MLSDKATVWWLGRGHNKGREILEQKLQVLFGDPKGAVEWARKGIMSRIVSKVMLTKYVSRACFLAIPMDIRAKKGEVSVLKTLSC